MSGQIKETASFGASVQTISTSTSDPVYEVRSITESFVQSFKATCQPQKITLDVHSHHLSDTSTVVRSGQAKW